MQCAEIPARILTPLGVGLYLTGQHKVNNISTIDACQNARRCQEWQSAVFVEKVLFSVRTFLTLTVRQTELGSPTSVR